MKVKIQMTNLRREYTDHSIYDLNEPDQIKQFVKLITNCVRTGDALKVYEHVEKLICSVG